MFCVQRTSLNILMCGLGKALQFLEVRRFPQCASRFLRMLRYLIQLLFLAVAPTPFWLCR